MDAAMRRGSGLARLLADTRPAVQAARGGAALLAPWIDLLIRFWLAQAFLTGAALRLVMNEAPAMMQGQGYGIDLLNDLVASSFGFAVQTLCPILLLAGLGARLAALPLLVQVLLLRGGAAPADIDVLRAALLGWIAVSGPGTVSFDALLGGIDSSAVPGGHRATALLAWTTRRVAPVYRLILRLGVALVVIAPALALRPGAASMIEPAAPVLATLSGMLAVPAGPLAWIVAAALVAGLGTRAAALVLLALVPFREVSAVTDARLYWALLLGVILFHGAGPLSLDRLLVRWQKASAKAVRGPNRDLPHVVVVGGGFGGVSAARALRSAPCRVTLVDARNYHLFQPLLYQVATAGLSPSDIATPIRSMFRGQANVVVRLAEVTAVDPDAKTVALDSGSLAYDYLVLATGSRHSYFGRDEWAGVAPGLKRIEDATDIRRRLLVAFERAEDTDEAEARRAWLTFVVVGGGPTGVELAGAIAELARHGLTREFRHIDPGEARVVLVQSAPRLLPTFPPSLSADAEGSLRRLGVDIRVSSRVEHVDADGVVLSGERMPARTVLWAAGVAASPAGRWLGTATDPAGRLVVGPDLSVPGHADVFAVGDTAASNGWDGNPVPGLAPAAKQGGTYVGRLIRARLTGRRDPGPFRYRHAGSLATIGRQSAVAEFGPVRFRGALAWWIWGLVHIVFLAGGRNRATVVVEWIWAYLTYGRGTRLITETRPAG